MLKQLKKAIPRKIKWALKKNSGRIKSLGRRKVFGIGFNKTGTTSLKAAMEELGFISGYQHSAELLINEWGKRNFNKIIRYCKTAQFFQDIPFSMPYTYIVLDHEFPKSKFILTVRDSPEQWYNSLIKFHAKKWGKNNRIPTQEDLKNASYLYKGWAWEMNRMSYNTPADEPYKKEVLIKFYNNYICSVQEYFRHRPNDLLILNVASKEAYSKLCNFLGVNSDFNEFPWKNKTKNIK